MFVITARNVNQAYREGISLLVKHGMTEQSRAGEVLVAPQPVVTKYAHPYNCVLFDAQRDANPFFHLAEAFWMLGGMRDARWLDHYISDFSERFAEADGSMHGAYGYRWRRHWFKQGMYCDQVSEVIDLLRKDTFTRRAVIQMWDPPADLGRNLKDHPCNLSIAFRVQQREGRAPALDMTVFCRSNDAVWGAYGANAVHFSFLQQYIAGALGMSVGTYWQISNNFHVYTDVLKKLRLPLSEPDDPYLGFMRVGQPIVQAMPLYDLHENQADINKDISEFILSRGDGVFHTQFFSRVVKPMYTAHAMWKKSTQKNDHQATLDWARANLMTTGEIRNDWHQAAYSWMERRVNK